MPGRWSLPFGPPIHGHDLVPDTFRGGPNLAFLVCRAGGARRESIWASKSSEAMG